MTDLPDVDKPAPHGKVLHGQWPRGTAEDALALLEGFGLTIVVGPEVATSAHHQIALLTLVNAARRTFLGGIEVLGVAEITTLVPLVLAPKLDDAVRELGGLPVVNVRDGWPCAIIGTPAHRPSGEACLAADLAASPDGRAGVPA